MFCSPIMNDKETLLARTLRCCHCFQPSVLVVLVAAVLAGIFTNAWSLLQSLYSVLYKLKLCPGPQLFMAGILVTIGGMLAQERGGKRGDGCGQGQCWHARSTFSHTTLYIVRPKTDTNSTEILLRFSL